MQLWNHVIGVILFIRVCVRMVSIVEVQVDMVLFN